MRPTFTDINRLVEIHKAHSDELKRCTDNALRPFIKAPSGTWLAQAASAVNRRIERYERDDGKHFIKFDYKGITFGIVVSDAPDYEYRVVS